MREGIYRKTDAGRDEIRDRSRRLAPPLRTVLLMVDGQRSLAQLREVMAGMKAPDDALEALLADGLIEPVASGFDVAGLVSAVAPRVAAQAATPPAVAAEAPAATLPQAATEAEAAAPPPENAAVSGAMPAGSDQYLHLYQRMSEAVRSHLGLRGYFLQLKVERCAGTSDLQALLPELRGALAKAKGESFAAEWERALEVPA